MKKLLLLAILLPAVIAVATTGCSDSKSTWEIYEEWRNDNITYLEKMNRLENADGSAYYQKVVPAWNPGVYVLIHYFNDRGLTAGNLVPLETSQVSVIYKGMLYEGTGFDSSYTAANPLQATTFEVTGVIDGWQIALQSMHVGDSVEVVIPYDLAYGSSTSGSIPPYSVLKFGMKLVDIVNYETKP